MGPPYVRKDRLYAFFDGYMKAIQDSAGRRDDYNANEQSISFINKISGLWSQETPRSLEEETPKAPVATGFSQASNITDDEIEEHVAACFTKGIEAAEGLSKSRPLEFGSDIQFMHDDERAYDFFLFWLDQPANEWLDAFLFEAADQWQDVIHAQEKNQAISESLAGLQSSSRFSTDNLWGLIKSGALTDKNQERLLELIHDLNDHEKIIQNLKNEINEFANSLRSPELFSTGHVQMTSEFFNNGYLMKRVKENKKNIGRVRHALRELELGDDK